jgi:hypothetical protein
MVVFAFKTTDEAEVEYWSWGVDKRLRSPDFFLRPLRGGLKRVDDGLFVMEVEPVYPRFLVNAMALMMAASAFFAWMVGLEVVAIVAFSLALLVGAVWNGLFLPFFYQIVVWVMVRRLTGSWHRVSRADSFVLREVLYG